MPDPRAEDERQRVRRELLQAAESYYFGPYPGLNSERVMRALDVYEATIARAALASHPAGEPDGALSLAERVEQCIQASAAWHTKFGSWIVSPLTLIEHVRLILAAGAAPDGRAPSETLTEAQADAVEAEMRSLEANPATTLRALRLFMQAPMPCGHAAGNLLTCDTPPFGCVICGSVS